MLIRSSILADDEVRQGLKAWVRRVPSTAWTALIVYQSDWPTFPQLYLKGELVGGLDIVRKYVGNIRVSTDVVQVQEELESDPEYFSEYQAAPKGKGGMAASEAQTAPIST